MAVHYRQGKRSNRRDRGGRYPSGSAARVVIGVVPIELRVIEEQFDALLVGFVGELLERIFGIRRALTISSRKFWNRT